MKDKDYYQKNKKEWKKGGKYYYYKPKQHNYKFTVKRTEFILKFD